MREPQTAGTSRRCHTKQAKCTDLFHKSVTTAQQLHPIDEQDIRNLWGYVPQYPYMPHHGYAQHICKYGAGSHYHMGLVGSRRQIGIAMRDSIQISSGAPPCSAAEAQGSSNRLNR